MKFMSKNQIMVDLETASTDPTAAIFSIGAVAFRFDTGITEEFYVNVDAVDCKKLGLHVMKDTMKWWSSQPSHVIKALQNPKPIPIKDALQQFFAFYCKTKTEFIWSHGASFDLPIIQHAAMIVDEELPYKYWSCMCNRTVMTMLDIRNDKLAANDKDAHNALSDARRQAETLINAFNQ